MNLKKQKCYTQQQSTGSDIPRGYLRMLNILPSEHVSDDAGHNSDAITDRYIDVELKARANTARNKTWEKIIALPLLLKQGKKKSLYFWFNNLYEIVL